MCIPHNYNAQSINDADFLVMKVIKKTVVNLQKLRMKVNTAKLCVGGGLHKQAQQNLWICDVVFVPED